MANLRRTYDRHFLLAELIISALIAGSVATAAVSGRFSLLPYIHGNRVAIYTTTTATLGTLLGFVITGVSVILALAESEKLKLLKRTSHYRTLFDVYISTARLLAIGTIISFLG